MTSHFGPGAVNAHTHIYSALAPYGMPRPEHPPANFVEILERIWWRLDRAIDERALAASARLYVAEALLHGTTALVDHHESPEFIRGSLDVIADACHELGMRAVLCYGATERNRGRDEGEAGLAECRRFIESNRRPLVRGVVGLHASFTVSDATAREAGDLARELGTVVHVHVAEDGADVEDARRRGHAGPLERLLALGALPPGSIMAHGVHLDESQVEEAGARCLWLVQNPRSNDGNRVGYPRALWASAKVALGTDGYPSDMDAECQELLRLVRAHPREEPRGTVAAGWRCLSGPGLVAELFGDPGAPDRDRVTLAVPGNGGARRVERVEIGGRVVVEDGALVAGDIEAIRAHARDEAPLLWARMEALA